MSYWRIIFKGGLGTLERWSASAAYGIVGLSSDTPDQTVTDAMLAKIIQTLTTSTVPTSLRDLLSSQGNLDSIRVEYRAEDESILNIAEGSVLTPFTGSNPATKTPQDSVVFSLRTSTPGARGRGRMYWPALFCTLSTSFQLTSPANSAVASGAKTLLQAVNGAMDDVYAELSIVKTVALSVRSVTDHVCRDVTSIQVGTVLDTQRRRRDTLPETYAAVAYP